VSSGKLSKEYTRRELEGWQHMELKRIEIQAKEGRWLCLKVKVVSLPSCCSFMVYNGGQQVVESVW
jgi:hypothetical protein